VREKSLWTKIQIPGPPKYKTQVLTVFLDTLGNIYDHTLAFSNIYGTVSLRPFTCLPAVVPATTN
jgi:hypothetical protein